VKLYLAGPMTGIPDFNFPRFHAEAARLRALGYEVVNPAELVPDTAAGWTFCMRKDIEALLSCSGIALMPGRHKSRGALLEHHIARSLEMHVFTVEEITAHHPV
jgi:hypothetical protein